MELVQINAYAEGYYSGQTHEENVFITKESYEKVKEDVGAIEIYVYDLDGKHSEVESDITIIELTEEELLEMDLNVENDGEDLYYKVKRLFENYEIDLNNEKRIVNEYLNTLDTLTTFEVTVKESQKEKVLEFIQTLN